ncbi:MAG: glutamate--tRNA ligase family protein, partial [Plesiomonas shigelloides]
MNELRYVGRFAPSPSGDLHFGSLVAALGSFLQARHRQGVWQLRIEDIDPPREVAGASERIIRTLEAYHLYWDGPIVYQSQRHAAYQAVIDTLLQQGDAYYCRCSRQQRQA